MFFKTKTKNIFIKRVNKKRMRNHSLNTKPDQKKEKEKQSKKHQNDIAILTILLYLLKANQVE